MNLAINNTLNEIKIFETRKILDLSGCNNKNATQLHCDNFCLFDLFEDPCETEDISAKQPEILEKLKENLGKFWREIVPHKISEPDERADPKRYNNTWVTWLDDLYTK